MLASSETVTKLIPQRPPMVMVDTLIDHDDQRTLTGFTVTDDNLFMSNGRLLEAGILENMAQSAALRTGWITHRENDRQQSFRPPVGVIGAVKNFKLFQLPCVNTHIETEIIILAEVFNATMVKAIMKAGEEVLAEAELKIFITENQEIKES